MLGRLGVRGKILAVVMVPILVLIFGAGAVTFQAARNLDDADNVDQLLDLVRDGHNLVDNLQAERDTGVNYVHTYQSGVTVHTNSARAVNESLATALNIADGSSDPRLTNAAKRILEITSLKTQREPEGTIEFADPEDIPPSGTLNAMRASVNVLVTRTGFPTWPSDAEVLDLVSQYAEMRNGLAAVLESVPSGAFADALEDAVFVLSAEAAAAEQALAGPPEYEDALAQIFIAVDRSVEEFFTTSAQVSDRFVNSRVIDLTASLKERLSLIESQRAVVYSLDANPSIQSAWYSQSVADLISITNEVAEIADDPVLANRLQAFASLDALVENVQIEKLVNERIIRQGFYGTNDLSSSRRQAVVTDLALSRAQTDVSILNAGLEVPGFGASLGVTGDQTSFTQIRYRLSLGTDSLAADQQSGNWNEQVQEELSQYVPTRDLVWRDALARSEELQNNSLISTLATAIGAAAVVGASLLIALLIARRIVGPLRRLTTTATAVRQELPRLVERVALPGQSVDVSEVQIPVESADEVGRLAEAFNSVNAATLAIAGEQAALRGSISEMFVNVARRDQVLLNRQLASIDEMERTEDDSDTLQRLFALDHLATRMRRNSESLLVLAGIDTGRRMRRPMPLSDVVRTASSEIELYERVQLELQADPSMLGHSALTAAHLFAELLENATVFSDPGTPVVVHTMATDTVVTVEVRDQGIGMTEDELREANERVVSTAASEILGAQRLGLFVVGRIARRIGATVALQSEEGVGTSAVVTMPLSLFDPDTLEGATPEAAAPAAPEQALPEFAAAPDESAAEVTSPAQAAPEQPPYDAPAPEAPEFEPPAPAPVARTETSMPDVAPGLETPPPGLPTRGETVSPTFVNTSAPVEEQPPASPADAEAPLDSDDIPLPPTPDGDFRIQSTPAPTPFGQSEAPASESLEDLIAADAAAAPEEAPVDTGALTSGTTESGLPSRRRREPGPESVAQTTSILGMPERPDTHQLDVLRSNGDTGFVPQVSSERSAPPTAEQRSSMFRGFQARREDYDSPALEPDAESFGQMQRRAAVAAEANDDNHANDANEGES